MHPETLDQEHQRLFQIVAVLHKNKKASESASLDVLFTLTRMNKLKLEHSLENLEDYKLIQCVEGQYVVSQMALNFVRQGYTNFNELEEETLGIYREIVKGQNLLSPVDLHLNSAKNLMDQTRVQEAETYLLDCLTQLYENKLDYAKLHHQLGHVQKSLQKTNKAAYSFEEATKFDPRNAKFWFDRILFEQDRRGPAKIVSLCELALEGTNDDVAIAIQLINFYKYKHDHNSLKETTKRCLEKYKAQNRKEDTVRLLRSWKQAEHSLLKNTSTKGSYIESAETLVKWEEDKEVKLQILRELARVVVRSGDKTRARKVRGKIANLENQIRGSISVRVQELNKLWNAKNYEEAIKEARKILTWYEEDYGDEEDIADYQSALRVLLQMLASEGKPETIITTFEAFKKLGYKDDNCIQVYEKAQRTVKENQRNNIIGEINTNLQDAEIHLRTIIMYTFGNDEQKLIELVKNKDKESWLEQWEMNRNKSLNKSFEMIHFSDLSHLRSLLAWQKSKLYKLADSESLSSSVKNIIENMVFVLERHVASERTEAAHARIQQMSDAELDKFKVDTGRFLEYTLKVKELMRIRT